MKIRLSLLAAILAIALPAFGADFFKSAIRSKATILPPENLVGTVAVHLDAEALSSMVPGDFIDLALPNGKSWAVTFDRSEMHANGDLSWFGHLRDTNPDFTVSATMGANGSYATILTPDGEFGVVPGGANDWVFDVGMSMLFLDRPAGETDARIPPLPLGPRAKAADPVCADITSKPTTQTTIDVLVVTAPDFVAAHGAANVETRLNTLFSNINNYYTNSNIAITLRRVARVDVSYGWASSVNDGTALDDITNGLGPFGNIDALRTFYGADMVSFVRGPQSSGAISGVAWIGGYGQFPISGSSQFMYSVSGDAPGYSGTLMAHEIGHNMGNNHDHANSGTNIDGATSYAYGHTVCGAGAIAGCPMQAGFNNAGTGFGTIMSYYRPTVPKFSSPNYTCTGTAAGGITATCGIAAGLAGAADETRTINCTRTGIASMKTAFIAGCANLALDTDGDGIPDCVEQAAGRNPNVKDNDIFSQAMLFALQQYRDFLGREGDAGGINFWTTQINTAAQTRGQMVENFFNSAEFQSTGAPVTRLYFAYFLRIPDYGGLTFWTNSFRQGNSLANISQAFATSQEFVNRYGALSNDQFVDLVYQNVLGRPADAGGKSFWLGQLNGGTTRGAMMLGFSESPEYVNTIRNSVYVTMMYTGMLRRSPDQGGFDFWKGYLGGGNSGLALINGFLASSEYRTRFLP